MLEPQTITDLNRALRASPKGFLIVDSGTPRYAVLDYATYKGLKEQRPKKILVTGGAGYIGSHTARLLRKTGYEVVVFDNLSTGRREAVRDCQLIVADLADRAALDKLFAAEKFDAVMHFAASIEVEESMADPQKYFQNNVVNGINLLDAMVEYGVKKLIFSSTGAVYGEPEKIPIDEEAACHPTSPYGESKRMFEEILKRYEQAYGLHSISLRYFNAAGAWPEEDLGYRAGAVSHLIPRVMDVAAGMASELEIFGQDYETPDGTGVRDYVHVLDLARAHLVALEKLAAANGSYVYNVGTGSGYSVSEIIDKSMAVTGRMIPMKFGPRRAGDPARVVADTRKIERELGFRAEHDLNDILQSSWAWHKILIK